MLLFILGIIALLVGVVAAFLIKEEAKTFGWIALIIGVIMLVISLFTSVPTGYTGILTTFGKVNDNTLEAGINLKAPWQDVVLMDNREQTREFSVLAFSSDIQEVKVSGTISFSIDKATAMKLYRDVGTNYYEVLVVPRLNEAVKVMLSQYTAEELITNRGQLSTGMLTSLNEATSVYGLNIINISIDVDFSDAFTDAVEAKQVATQVMQRVQTEQQQETMIAEQTAARLQIEAEAAAAVARTQADAEAYAITTKAQAEAQANALISESLTETLIEYTEILQWNGMLPGTVIDGAAGVLPILN
jgi:regulator of protease activity HflC (stomatin/prohibitin superfamily)